MPSTQFLSYQADRDLAERSRWSTLFYLMLFLITISFTSYIADHPFIPLITGILLLLGTFHRTYCSIRFDKLYKQNPKSWRINFTVGVVWVAATWGIFCMMSVVYYQLDWTAMLILLTTAGISAGAVTILSIRSYLISAYLSLMLLPTVIATVFMQTAKGYAVMLLFIMFFAFLLMVAKRLHGEYWNALRNTHLLDQRAKELEASNKELESYSYSIAHDLRSPLRSIVSFSQILLDESKQKLSKDEQGNLLRVINASKYLAKLIDDILELSRITRREFHSAPVDLSKLVDNCAHQLSEQEPGHHVKWKIEPGLQTKGDIQLLNVAIQNLIGNSWKFTHNGPNKAEIQFGAETKQDQVVYYVKDNGVGFDMKYSDKLFNTFQRLHNQDYEGTGIGLATVARVVNRHGGKVWAEGSPGEGATFYFTLDQSVSHTH